MPGSVSPSGRGCSVRAATARYRLVYGFHERRPGRGAGLSRARGASDHYAAPGSLQNYEPIALKIVFVSQSSLPVFPCGHYHRRARFDRPNVRYRPEADAPQRLKEAFLLVSKLSHDATATSIYLHME